MYIYIYIYIYIYLLDTIYTVIIRCGSSIGTTSQRTTIIVSRSSE